MNTILSRTNPEIKKIASLHQTKYRKQSGLFLAEGLRVITTLIQSGMQPAALYATERLKQDALDLYPESTLVADEVMEKISSARTPSGIVGVFAIPKSRPKVTAPGLVMAQIADPGNMGTLIRSAAAMNIKHIVVVEGVDPWSPKVVQASAGTIGSVHVHQISWQELTAQKHQLCALVVDGGKAPDQLDLKNYVLVIGSEAHGIKPEWLADCQEQLTLPMPGKTESLNAGVAGSIALYLMQ